MQLFDTECSVSKSFLFLFHLALGIICFLLPILRFQNLFSSWTPHLLLHFHYAFWESIIEFTCPKYKSFNLSLCMYIYLFIY
jgi:hypothetical protein